jgi:probable HAF family extracellular repeat protein
MQPAMSVLCGALRLLRWTDIMRRKPIQKLLALSLALGATSHLVGQTPAFQLIDFPGAASTQSWGINSRGDIVGFYTNADKSSHGFLFSGGHYSPIDFPGAAVTLLNGIDDRGNIVGEFGVTLTSAHRGFVLSTQGSFTPIDYPGATVTSAIGIAPSGEIVGYYALADNVNHSFVYKGNRFTPIDYPGAVNTVVNGIGPQGDVVGGYKITSAARGFLLSNGYFTAIDYPGAVATIPTGINGSGEIAGRYTDSANANHAFLLREGKFSSIDYPGATFTGATAIDASGNILGRCTVGGLTHGFLLSTPRPVTRYHITDLGPVGGPPGQPYVMADNGLLSGAAVAQDGTMHAVLWYKGFEWDLGSPGLGGRNSIGLAVNNRGQSVGSAEAASPDRNGEDFCGLKADGFPSNGAACVPFLWQNGFMSPLPTLGGVNGQASWINNRGEIVGTSENFELDPTCPSPQKFQFKPVIWENGQIEELPTLGSDVNGYAFSINESGQAVGASGDCAGLQGNGTYLLARHALLWQTGTVTDLGSLGGTGKGMGIVALGINNLGQAVGASDIAGDETFHGFIWSRETGMQDVGTLPGDVASGALGINDAGEMIGVSFDKDFNPTAFVQQPGGVMTDLNTLIPANSPLFLILGCSINSRGELAGIGVNDAGEAHAFLASPIGSSAGSEESAPVLQEVKKRVILSASARKELQQHLRFGQIGRVIGSR